MGLCSKLMMIAGLLLIYLGALNTILSMVTGTCTGGSADQLFGGLLSLLLYAVGWGLIYFSKLRLIWLTVLLPIIPVAWWQLEFVVRLGYGFIFANLGACTILGHGDRTDGPPEGWFDGREMIFIVIWVAANLAFLLGGLTTFFKARMSPQS